MAASILGGREEEIGVSRLHTRVLPLVYSLFSEISLLLLSCGPAVLQTGITLDQLL